MKTDNEIRALLNSEEDIAIAFEGEISRKRELLLNYYNQQPIGGEVEGQSQVVTSDVMDVVESMLPSLLKVFTQNVNIAIFEADREESTLEAKQKTFYANWVFNRANEGTQILYNMFKDALLQYTGIVKVYWDDSKETKQEKYVGLSDNEVKLLLLDEDTELESDEVEDDVRTTIVNFTRKIGKIKIENIPVDEFLFNRDARDFIDPKYINHRCPRTRTQLKEMGFDADIVDSLPADVVIDMTRESQARNHDLERWSNPSTDKTLDMIYLNESYVRMDIDEDGIAERWQIFKAGNEILEKTRVDGHPFAVAVPIPIPHRAIGTCPADQVADIQKIKSTLTRQLLDNIYQNNYARTAVNDRVELDDLLTPRAGGIVRVNDSGPIGDSILPMSVQPIAPEILGVIEYQDSVREVRSGITRLNQGLDTESLNKTATGFRGLMDASQQRLDMIARIFADGGVKIIFKKIIELATKHQSDSQQINVLGQIMEVNPSDWRDEVRCRVDIGIGSGDKLEKVTNLNNILMVQKEMIEKGSKLADEVKMFNTLDKLVTEVGLKNVSTYFNDPSKPEALIVAENEQLQAQLASIEEQAQNPLIMAEKIRAEGALLAQQQKQEFEGQKLMLKMQQEADQFRKEMIQKLTEMELKFGQNVPGSVV